MRAYIDPCENFAVLEATSIDFGQCNLKAHENQPDGGMLQPTADDTMNFLGTRY